MASIIPVENETKGTSTRMTHGGRRITYEMTVVQQPERARACGQGAKSSTDRRPVDPPPIVDLRIFEGEEGNKVDVTCAWNANFFLYASLEQARPIAQGRVPAPSNNAPILTGTPVAGMSYLDRPSPAGYFIFPDLSVRHEGKYRLSFQLYEETRENEDKDPADALSSEGIGEHYAGRCQVKSVPFTVYSAKKFPGLAESTHLSRMVADQGCRVRIRRDVRMRRRDNKDSKEWDEYDEKPGADLRRTPTPEPSVQATAPSPEASQPPQQDAMDTCRPSNNSSYNGAVERRDSTQEPNHQYQQYHQPYVQHQQQQPQQQQQQPSAQTPHPSYVPHAQYDPAAIGQYHQQYIQQQTVAQSPQQMHPPQHYPYGYPPQSMVQYPPGYYMQYQQQQGQPQPQQPMYDQQMGHVRYDGMSYGAPPPPPPPPPQYSNPAMPPAPQYAPQPHMPAPLGSLGPGYGRMIQPPSPNYTTQAPAAPTHPIHGKDLPPLKALETFPGKYETPSPSVGLSNDRAPPYVSYPETNVPLPPQYITSGPTTAKRSFGTVFSTLPMDQPLRAGARPGTSNGSQDVMMVPAYEDGSDEDVLDMESLKMQYRRADGTQVSRRWPTARA